MGRATRWLRSLWGGDKENKETKDCSSYGGEARTEKKRWSFRKSRSSGDVAPGQNASTAAAIEAAWFKCFYAESEKEHSKHAIAVAAATAAAADAAVAMARLTSHGAGARDQLAAVKIQTAFRGYLVSEILTRCCWDRDASFLLHVNVLESFGVLMLWRRGKHSELSEH